MMTEENTYTLEDLARDFDLTARTARHYIANVLPPHHKKGRGKLARYGQDTWNCFAFIQKVREQAGVTMTYLNEALEADKDLVKQNTSIPSLAVWLACIGVFIFAISVALFALKWHTPETTPASSSDGWD